MVKSSLEQLACLQSFQFRLCNGCHTITVQQLNPHTIFPINFLISSHMITCGQNHSCSLYVVIMCCSVCNVIRTTIFVPCNPSRFQNYVKTAPFFIYSISIVVAVACAHDIGLLGYTWSKLRKCSVLSVMRRSFVILALDAMCIIAVWIATSIINMPTVRSRFIKIGLKKR